jgi:prephenate dehydrogenase
MNVGIAGVGLIGGSFARAYKAAGHTVYLYDNDESIVTYAQLAGVSDGALDGSTLPTCDLILIALYPSDAIAYMEQIAPQVSKQTIVLDCCGTKRVVCEAGFRLAAQYGYSYVGGHPMAGTQYSGFKNSRATMFKGAPMVIVPPEGATPELLQAVKDLLAPAEFGRITVASAEQHDEMIAFTSQLAHVVSNAYIKSPTARTHKGFSAGSYKDLTRVAWLNEKMWTDLFLENADNLGHELDILIDALGEYRAALRDNDAPRLEKLLAEGRMLKEEVDGR